MIVSVDMDMDVLGQKASNIDIRFQLLYRHHVWRVKPKFLIQFGCGFCENATPGFCECHLMLQHHQHLWETRSWNIRIGESLRFWSEQNPCWQCRKTWFALKSWRFRFHLRWIWLWISVSVVGLWAQLPKLRRTSKQRSYLIPIAWGTYLRSSCRLQNNFLT